MESKSSFEELKLLITEAVEGTALPEQMTRLNRILASSRSARQFYFEFIDIHVLTEHLCAEKLFLDAETTVLDSDATKHDLLLQALAAEEYEADTIVIEPPACEPVVRPVAVVEMAPRKISKLSLAAMILSAAALLFLVLFARYAPPKLGYEVATVTDSLHARWAEGRSPERGERIATSHTPLVLQEGFVQVRFDNQAEVVIEAPAQFALIAEDQLRLTYGRAFAMVPEQAIGFTVSSQKTKVIDLGTEFGVYTSLNGDIELHVIQGKTLLLPEYKGGVKSLEVGAGAAKRVSPERAVADIPCDKRVFARRIDSRANQVWRGQKRLLMTDMLLGGDGQNPQHGLGKIDLLTGRRTGLLFVPSEGNTPGFRAAADNPFVDGVFIPDRGAGEVVSSTGLRFAGCPDTSGTAFYHITNFPEIPSIGADETHPLRLAGTSDPQTPMLLLHPNAGITFDLAAVRERFAEHQITGFTTRYGFPATLAEKRSAAKAGEAVLSPESSTVDFYVLTDGAIRGMISLRMPMEPRMLEIPISDRDRFLTLAAADGNGMSNFDWLVLEAPTLVLEE